jgi:hypothetical protein
MGSQVLGFVCFGALGQILMSCFGGNQEKYVKESKVDSLDLEKSKSINFSDDFRNGTLKPFVRNHFVHKHCLLEYNDTVPFDSL